MLLSQCCCPESSLPHLLAQDLFDTQQTVYEVFRPNIVASNQIYFNFLMHDNQLQCACSQYVQSLLWLLVAKVLFFSFRCPLEQQRIIGPRVSHIFLGQSSFRVVHMWAGVMPHVWFMPLAPSSATFRCLETAH